MRAYDSCSKMTYRHQGRHPLKGQLAEEVGAILPRHDPLFRHWRFLAPFQRVHILVPWLLLFRLYCAYRLGGESRCRRSLCHCSMRRLACRRLLFHIGPRSRPPTISRDRFHISERFGGDGLRGICSMSSANWICGRVLLLGMAVFSHVDRVLL